MDGEGSHFLLPKAPHWARTRPKALLEAGQLLLATWGPASDGLASAGMKIAKGTHPVQYGHVVYGALTCKYMLIATKMLDISLNA